MMLIAKSSNMADYLAESPVIDFYHPEIIALSEHLRRTAATELDLVRSIYEFVRDQISHSADIAEKIVACTASEVLKARQGICFAKSHLLAALLRHNRIPAGFCYQLLRLNDDTSTLVLHGLNAVYPARERRWIRLDARGNRPGVNAQLCVLKEKLAFPVREELGETDFPMIYESSDPNVLAAYAQSRTFEELWSNLPSNISFS